MCAKKSRAINLPGSPIGFVRGSLYKKAFERINDSLKAGFYLEAITIEESIIADLLERRIAWLSGQFTREFSNLGPLTAQLRSAITPETDTLMLGLLTGIDAWRIQRNEIHEVVKLPDSHLNKDWDTEYQRFKQVAEDGKKLTNKLSKNLRRVNK